MPGVISGHTSLCSIQYFEIPVYTFFYFLLQLSCRQVSGICHIKTIGEILMSKKDEFWDVYTKDRKLTGKRHKRGEKMSPGEYHMVVHVCVFNSQNQLLIQQRQPFKDDWANMWDVSAAGSALAGETSFQAAEREVFEEIGLELDLTNVRPYFTINFPEGFDDYYLIEADVDLNELKLQPEEVKAAKWAGKEEILKMQENGEFVPYWFLGELFDIRGFYGARDNEKMNSNEFVTVTVDRPMGSVHPNHDDIVYPINYGYIEGIMAPDGEEQDAYIIGVNEPVKIFTGKVIAVIHRNDDVEEKWVVCPEKMTFTKEEIWEKVKFQERYFDSEVVM